jgi:predicted ester cyclase
LLLPVVFCFLISCQDKQAVADLEACKTQKEIEKLNKSVVQSYWNGKWNERRPAILDELLTQDVIHHGSTEINGVEEYKQVYGMYLSALDDTQIEIEKLIAKGDFVMIQLGFELVPSKK